MISISVAHLAEAIDCDDGNRAAKIIQDALGIESDDIANYHLAEAIDCDDGNRAAKGA